MGTVATCAQSLKKEQRNQQTEQLLDRIVDSSSVPVIATENRIEKLDKKKMVIEEKLQNSTKPRHTFEQMFEHAMQFPARP